MVFFGWVRDIVSSIPSCSQMSDCVWGWGWPAASQAPRGSGKSGKSGKKKQPTRLQVDQANQGSLRKEKKQPTRLHVGQAGVSFNQARASAPLRLPCPASIFCPASLFWGKASPRLGDWCPMWDSHTQKYPMCGPHPDSCLGFGPQKYPAQLERARLVKWFWATKMGAFFFEGFSAT